MPPHLRDTPPKARLAHAHRTAKSRRCEARMSHARGRSALKRWQRGQRTICPSGSHPRRGVFFWRSPCRTNQGSRATTAWRRPIAGVCCACEGRGHCCRATVKPRFSAAVAQLRRWAGGGPARFGAGIPSSVTLRQPQVRTEEPIALLLRMSCCCRVVRRDRRLQPDGSTAPVARDPSTARPMLPKWRSPDKNGSFCAAHATERVSATCCSFRVTTSSRL